MVKHNQRMGSKVRLEIESFKPRRLVLEEDIKEGITLKNLLNELATTHREVVEAAFDLHSQELTGEVIDDRNSTTEDLHYVFIGGGVSM